MPKEKSAMIQFPVTGNLHLTEEERKEVLVVLQAKIERITMYETQFDKIHPAWVDEREICKSVIAKLN